MNPAIKRYTAWIPQSIDDERVTPWGWLFVALDGVFLVIAIYSWAVSAWTTAIIFTIVTIITNLIIYREI